MLYIWFCLASKPSAIHLNFYMNVREQKLSCSCCGILLSDFCTAGSFETILASKMPTCSATVCANSEFELLLGRCNLKVVIHGISSLWSQAQVEPQLILSRSVGELVYLLQTWGKSQTGSVRATYTRFNVCRRQANHWSAHRSKTPQSCCQNLPHTVSSVSESPTCQLFVAGEPERRKCSS